MATSNVRKQHEHSNVFMPKPGLNRRRSGGPGAQRLSSSRPIPPGRTSTGHLQQPTSAAATAATAAATTPANTISHRHNTTSHISINSQQPVKPFFGPWPGHHGPAPTAQMIAPEGDVARDIAVNNLSQQLNDLPSSLTPARSSASEASSSEPGEIAAERQEEAPQPSPPQTQSSAVPSIDWGEKTRRAAAVQAGQNIKELEALRNQPFSSQRAADYFRKGQEVERRRDEDDPIFVRGTTEDPVSDQEVDDDEVESESIPVEPESVPAEPIASSSKLARKRPSPEPEVSDGAKKQKAFTTDFRIRAYDRLEPEGKQDRDDLLNTIKKNWGPRWELAFPRDLWLIDSKTKSPQHPKNWGSTALQKIIQLSSLTAKDPARASAALKEAIARRTALGQGSARLERNEDIEVAKQIVAQNSPHVGRAPPPSPPVASATLADVLRASTSSISTLDHDTPTRGPARRDSASGRTNISPTQPTTARAEPQIKYESDNAPFSPKSPRLGQPRKIYSVAELFALDIDTLEKAYRSTVTLSSQVDREMFRRRPGTNGVPALSRELSKLNTEALFQLQEQTLDQKELLRMEVQGRTMEIPGADSSEPMVLDN